MANGTPTASNSTILGDSNGNTYINAQGGASMYFGVNNIYKFNINSNGVAINNGGNLNAAGVGLVVGSGNVGINTTTPQALFDIKSSGHGYAMGMRLSDSDGTNYTQFLNDYGAF